MVSFQLRKYRSSELPRVQWSILTHSDIIRHSECHGVAIVPVCFPHGLGLGHWLPPASCLHTERRGRRAALAGSRFASGRNPRAPLLCQCASLAASQPAVTSFPEQNTQLTCTPTGRLKPIFWWHCKPLRSPSPNKQPSASFWVKERDHWAHSHWGPTQSQAHSPGSSERWLAYIRSH